jgi:adenosine deaminase
MRTVHAAAVTVLLAALAVPTVAAAQRLAAEGELRAAKALDAVRGDPLALLVFLKRMPKGGELHNHLHSAVFAETLIRDAIEPLIRLSGSPRGRESG